MGGALLFDPTTLTAYSFHFVKEVFTLYEEDKLLVLNVLLRRYKAKQLIIDELKRAIENKCSLTLFSKFFKQISEGYGQLKENEGKPLQPTKSNLEVVIKRVTQILERNYRQKAGTNAQLIYISKPNPKDSQLNYLNYPNNDDDVYS